MTRFSEKHAIFGTKGPGYFLTRPFCAKIRAKLEKSRHLGPKYEKCVIIYS
jgi:hypothetical protein